MTGSHLDSVPEGGNYDGAAGVVAGMAMLARWRRAGGSRSSDITVMGVRAEELSWFPAPYIGSRAAFGLLEPEALDGCRRPDTGRTLAEHMKEAGFAPDRIRAREPQLDPATHPLLLRAAYRAGAGAGRRRAAGRHRHRHPRQPPLSRRPCDRTLRPCRRRAARDAATMRVLAGVEFVSRLEALWLAHETAGKDLVCTVGQFHTDTEVHTMTKIPGEVWFSMDIRSEDNDVLLAIDRELRDDGRRRSARGAASRIDLGAYTNAKPGPIDTGHRARLERLAKHARHRGAADGQRRGPRRGGVRQLQGVPTAMIFMRNEHGSHNPDEAMELADFAQGLRLLVAAVEEIDGRALG